MYLGIRKHNTSENGVHPQPFESIQQDLAKLYRKYAKDGKLYWTEMNRYKRLQALEASIKDMLGKNLRDVDAYIEKQTIAVFKDSFNRHAWAIDQDAGFAFSWGSVPDKSVASIVKSPLSKLSDSKDLATDRAVKVNKVRNEITLSLVRGESYQKMSQRIGDVLGFRENGRYAGRGAAYKSTRIARTEGQRAAVEGQQATYAKAEGIGIKLEYVWDVALDKRTRAAHGALDGQKRGEDGFFNTPVGKVAAPLQSGVASFDIHCRCSLRAQIPGYPPQMRYVRGDGKRPWIGYDAWKKAKEAGGDPFFKLKGVGKNGGMVRIPNSINKKHIEYRQNIAAASVLANDGYMVQFIGPASNVKGQKTADVLIDGVKWEIKTITAPNKNTVKRSIRTAAKQADNIILNIKSEIEEIELKDAVSDRIRQNTSIHEVAVIRKDRTVTRYSRAAILKWKK